MCTPTPYNGVPAAVPGKVEAEEYDDDGDCDGFYVPPYYEPKPDDPDIVYNYPEVLPVDLNAPDKEEKVAMVGGEWINYTISVTVAGEYRFAARVASAVDGESFHVKIDGVNRTGSVIIPNTGSWDSYQMVEADLGYLEAGRHVMRLAIEGNSEKSGHFDYYLLTLPPPCTDNDGDGYCSDVDCDDWDPLNYPGAPRDCSSWVDRDCDGIPNREECSFGGPGPILSLLDSFDRWFAFNSRLGADLIRPVSMRRRCR
ncbi:carbohydrate-binding protein [Pyrinomonas methylaliphatogenes]|uniref:CBM6-containing protein n=1 Tax=Pyrinomonas methylaliphatogenes TaxID=454194 RepID=A0A0B6X2R0_9BACT|nr:carbohydrate-binding protein [Pyrinomonas methylaliphatogenes]CDM66585.1 CBM6-containing protein [Pyrinomonas methylaliphatogenes]